MTAWKRFVILRAVGLAMMLAPNCAMAQSACQYIAYGAVLTAAQWNSCFTAKQDYLGFTPINPANVIGVAPVTLTPSGGDIYIGLNYGGGLGLVGSALDLLPAQTATLGGVFSVVNPPSQYSTGPNLYNYGGVPVEGGNVQPNSPYLGPYVAPGFNEVLTGINSSGQPIPRGLMTLSQSADGLSIPGFPYADFPTGALFPGFAEIAEDDTGYGLPTLAWVDDSFSVLPNTHTWFAYNSHGNLRFATNADSWIGTTHATGAAGVTALSISRAGIEPTDALFNSAVTINPRAPYGNFLFNALPNPSAFITLNGTPITFVSGTPLASTSQTCSIAGTTMTCPSGPGAIAAGQVLSSTGATPIVVGTTVVSGSGTSWVVSQSQTVASETIIFCGCQVQIASSAQYTGSIAPATTTLNVTVVNNLMTLTSAAPGPVVIRGVLTGSAIIPNPNAPSAPVRITGLVSGVSGAAGSKYSLSENQSIPTSAVVTLNYGLLTVTADSGVIALGDSVTDQTGDITPNTSMMLEGTGTGGLGTYYVDTLQTVASEPMFSNGTQSTLQKLIVFLDASPKDANLAQATYTDDGNRWLFIDYYESGTAGTAYTTVAGSGTNMVASGANLTYDAIPSLAVYGSLGVLTSGDGTGGTLTAKTATFSGIMTALEVNVGAGGLLANVVETYLAGTRIQNMGATFPNLELYNGAATAGDQYATTDLDDAGTLHIGAGAYGSVSDWFNMTQTTGTPTQINALVPMAINLTGATLPAKQTGTVLQIAGANGAAMRLELDGFGTGAVTGASRYTCVRADGTGASPTAVQSGDEICSLNAFAYYGAGTSAGPAAAFRTYAAQNWGAGAYGTYSDIATTPIGSTTLTSWLRIENDGGIDCTGVSGGDKGAGSINCGAIYVNGAPVITSAPYLPLAGGTMSGPIAMGGNNITGIGALSLSGQITSTEATGTAPFVVASTTQVANLNASQLIGATWASPGAIGITTPNTGAFSTLAALSATITPTPTVTLVTDQAQATGGSKILAFASVTGTGLTQIVSGTSVPLGDQVAGGVGTAQKTEAANGSFSSGQAVIPMATTTGFAVSQQCTDTTSPTTIGAGNVILSIQTNVSITMTSNVAANSGGAADSITCDPTVTLAIATTAAIGSGASISFTANQTTVSAAAALVDTGAASIYGVLNVGGALSLPATASFTVGTLNIAGSPFIQAYGTNNAFFAGAGNFTLTGSIDLGIGNGALAALTSGINNVGIGKNALLSDTTGGDNTAVGYLALANVISSSSNSAFGYDALGAATGAQNAASGTQALSNVTTGGANTGVGYDTGQGITTGNYDTILGAMINLGGNFTDVIAIGTGEGTIRADFGKTNSGDWTLTGGLVVPSLTTAGLATVTSAGLFGSEASATVPQGGTGLATLTANTIYKGNGTSALAASSLTDDGTTVATAENVTFSGLATSGTIAGALCATSAGSVLYKTGGCGLGTGFTTAGTGLAAAGATINSNGVAFVSFQPGLMTAVSGNIAGFHKFSKASTVDNIEGSAQQFSCTGNPTITMYECGTSATCTSPTAIGSATITAASTRTDGTISSASIAAGDSIAFAITAGTCVTLDASLTAQVHSN
jgi:hypothetical protein